MKTTVRALCASVAFMLSITSCAGTKAIVVDPSSAPDSLVPVASCVQSPREGVYYSLFVRSFADSNGDGIGDFNGITKRLDYLNDGDDTTTTDLGITGLWLLPIFPSHSYHGYDVDDYYAVNPQYGTMADFEKMIAECNKRGISVILDMTCNHSSSYIEWFEKSRDPNSEYRSWYRWITDLDFSENGGPYARNQKGLSGNIWKMDLTAPWVDKNGKTAVDKTGNTVMSYYAGLFSENMPDLNMDEPKVREEYKKIFKFWLDKGVAGFRFDAAGHIYKSAEVKPGDETQSKAIAFWKEMNDYIKSVKPDAYCVSEVWENTSTRARYMAGVESNFHFDLGTRIVDIINNQEINENDPDVVETTDKSKFNGFARSLAADYSQYKKFNPDYIDAPFLSNHDQARSASALRSKPEKMKLAADMYILAEGIPFIYYGEEIAMKSGSQDPTKRTGLVWKPDGKDKMMCTWTNDPTYGNAINIYNKKTVSVEEQNKDPNSLLNHYKRIIRVKTSHPSLLRGRLVPVGFDDPVLESYVMETSEEKSFVVHNVSASKTITSKIPEGCEMPVVYAANPGVKVEDGNLTIPPMTTVVMAKRK